MPPGTPYHSFIPPYPIRVDEFTDPKNEEIRVPALHLLTHTHSDHVIGLNAKSFGGTIVCSVDAKEMLLRHETYASRYKYDLEYQSEKNKTYSHLKTQLWIPRPGQADAAAQCVESRDLLRALPLHTPTEFELSNDERVTITLLDANHCPGAVMFLIEGPKGAILHTGDFRAEPIFISSLMRNPFVQRYVAPCITPSKSSTSLSSSGSAPTETLAAIYLDTASLMTTFEVPSKEDATNGLVKLMALYPPNTRFFINTWTWGYEEILKAVAHAFSSKIHVDRYKHSVYSNLTDPFLRSILTRDATSTRFHACERFDRCAAVPFSDRSVVYINPVKMSVDNWNDYYGSTRTYLMSKEKDKPYPPTLLVPLARHSSLPELQRFVGLFKPLRLIPNFLEPKLHGLDWACMSMMFGPYMRPSANKDAIMNELREAKGLDTLDALDEDEDIVNLERQNLESAGGSAESNGAATNGSSNELTEVELLARKWCDIPDLPDDTKTKTILRKMRAFLPRGLMDMAERVTRDTRERRYGVYQGNRNPNAVGYGARSRNVREESQEDSQSDLDEESQRARMAEWLFGGPTEDYRSPVASPARMKNRKQIERVDTQSPKGKNKKDQDEVRATNDLRVITETVIKALPRDEPAERSPVLLVPNSSMALESGEKDGECNTRFSRTLVPKPGSPTVLIPNSSSSVAGISSPTLNAIAANAKPKATGKSRAKTPPSPKKQTNNEQATVNPSIKDLKHSNASDTIPMVDLRKLQAHTRKSRVHNTSLVRKADQSRGKMTVSMASSSKLMPPSESLLEPFELKIPERIEGQGIEGWTKVLQDERAKAPNIPNNVCSRKGKDKERLESVQESRPDILASRTRTWVESTTMAATARERAVRTSPRPVQRQRAMPQSTPLVHADPPVSPLPPLLYSPPSASKPPRSPETPRRRHKREREELQALSPERRRLSASLSRAMSEMISKGISLADITANLRSGDDSKGKKREAEDVGVVEPPAKRMRSLPAKSANTSSRTTPLIESGRIDVDESDDPLEESQAVHTQGDGQVDWARSRKLRDEFLQALDNGGYPILPRCNFMEGWQETKGWARKGS